MVLETRSSVWVLCRMLWLALLAAVCAGASAGDAPQHFEVHPFTNASGSPRPPHPFIGAGFTRGADGQLYGISPYRGDHGFGRIVRFSREGRLETVHSFTGGEGGQGSNSSKPVLASDGMLYGIAFKPAAQPCGVFYRLSPEGEYTVIAQVPVENCIAVATLVEGADGNFYGSSNGYLFAAPGSLFKVTPQGVFTTLHQLEGGPDGVRGVYDPMVLGRDGNFYGVAHEGGPENYGSVFRMTPTGEVSLVHAFSALREDGYFPTGIIQATDGAIYGACGGGGTDAHGLVYRLTTAGEYTPLFSFRQDDLALGYGPAMPFMQADDGDLYAATAFGGANDAGTIYRMSLAGEMRPLRAMGPRAGAGWAGPLVQAVDGRLYGATTGGSDHRSGALIGLGR